MSRCPRLPQKEHLDLFDFGLAFASIRSSCIGSAYVGPVAAPLAASYTAPRGLAAPLRGPVAAPAGPVAARSDPVTAAAALLQLAATPSPLAAAPTPPAPALSRHTAEPLSHPTAEPPSSRAARQPSRPAAGSPEPPSRPAVEPLLHLPTRPGPTYSDWADGLSLFDLTPGASPAPPATADSTVRSQWATRDAAARLAVRRHLPTTERAHFSQYKSAQTLYDAVVARFSSPATAALSRLVLPYLFPDLAAFPTVADLITHLRTSDTRYRAALPAEFCAHDRFHACESPAIHRCVSFCTSS
ncbi:unnamed protein product [Closterium sp. NIES-54]